MDADQVIALAIVDETGRVLSRPRRPDRRVLRRRARHHVAKVSLRRYRADSIPLPFRIAVDTRFAYVAARPQVPAEDRSGRPCAPEGRREFWPRRSLVRGAARRACICPPPPRSLLQTRSTMIDCSTADLDGAYQRSLDEPIFGPAFRAMRLLHKVGPHSRLAMTIDVRHPVVARQARARRSRLDASGDFPRYVDPGPHQPHGSRSYARSLGERRCQMPDIIALDFARSCARSWVRRRTTSGRLAAILGWDAPTSMRSWRPSVGTTQERAFDAIKANSGSREPRAPRPIR